MTDPFLSLVTDALNLTHPRFAAASGLAYTPDKRKSRPRRGRCASGRS